MHHRSIGARAPQPRPVPAVPQSLVEYLATVFEENPLYDPNRSSEHAAYMAGQAAVVRAVRKWFQDKELQQTEGA